MKKLLTFDIGEAKSTVDATVEMAEKGLAPGIKEYMFSFSWDSRQARQPDASISIWLELPLLRAQYLWHPKSGRDKTLQPEWRFKNEVMTTISAPVACVYDSADQNAHTFASSEVKKVCKFEFGVNEHNNCLMGRIVLPLKQFSTKASHTFRLLHDSRKVPYSTALSGVCAWWEQDISPMPVPKAAYLPMYSTWYNFHQHLTDRIVEDACKNAAELGFSGVIVDDGWQTEDVNCGYAFCGDWAVCEKKFPDMRAHVARVHAMGLKYILWYSVPFVGDQSKNWERFKGKTLYTIKRLSASVLDPRFPDVREFLIGIYEAALRDYDLDGFKLDFVDRLLAMEGDTLKPGMDYACVQDATDRLMTDIMCRLRAIKPDILIEFRQAYIGPNMRKYGNMFRVNDCPGDGLSNRVGICDLRLLSGNTAVHSDMLTWHEESTPSDAALQILDVLFGVLQFAVKIDTLPPAHRKMVEFWMGFMKENRDVLLHSAFLPSEPHLLYPLIKATDGKTAVIGIYGQNKVAVLGEETTVKLANATRGSTVYVDVPAPVTARVQSYDCTGGLLYEEERAFAAGPAAIPSSPSGLVVLTF